MRVSGAANLVSIEETSSWAMLHIAETLLERRELAEAITAFTSAEANGAAADQCCAGRWLAHMLSGDFEAAWCENDSIRARGAPDPHRFWLGEDFRGKRVMLRCLHGLGDSVHFLRYVALLREEAAKLIVEVPPALLDLMPFFAGIEEVITWGEQAPHPAPEWDVQMEVTELPYVFRTTCSELPLATSYLRLPAAELERCRPEPSNTASLRVGVVWASGVWNPARSVSLNLLEKVLQMNGCEFWNLQGGLSREDWNRVCGCEQLHSGESCASSVLGLAALISQMDLILTSDTLAAHLAGALNVPAWVMIECAADWRWMHERGDSPWYPSMRLFRQRHRGDWSDVIGMVETALKEKIYSRQQRAVIT